MTSKIDSGNLPQHIAIIMDGNRRWAAARGLTAGDGHKAGAKNLEVIMNHCLDLGVKHLTVYALSTENWQKRSPEEVKGIFDLLVWLVKNNFQKYAHADIRLNILGNFTVFPDYVTQAINQAVSVKVKNPKLIMNIALNYGGRDELITAVKKIIKAKTPSDQINEDLISQYLYTAGQPEPELIIRPGGEVRLSNFLLWQSSYSELYFSDILWPDFGPKQLDQAIIWYQQRQRRLGK
ncbi:MAG TPA: polyprenyl diphosphate synthase [Candidatus Woesebacteria bacterium]|nr:polyprenyl diphosphate synthase [Candidatus Woesebacteria bacterium]